jgi:hypothetical protein
MFAKRSTFRPSVEVLENRLCQSGSSLFIAGGEINPADVGDLTYDAAPVAGQLDSFIKLDGVDAPGREYDEKWIEVQSFQWATPPAPAQVDYFLKLATIDGEATDASFFDGRLLTAMDLTREQSIDAGVSDPEYKYVTVRRTADTPPAPLSAGDLADWQSNYGSTY